MRDSKRRLALVICLLVILLSPGITQAENLKLRITVNQAKIHMRPDARSLVLSIFRLGSVLESDKKIGNWFRVILPSDKNGAQITGFVHVNLVEVIIEGPEKQPAEEVSLEEEKPVDKKPVEEKPSVPPTETIEPTKPIQPAKAPPPSVLQPSAKSRIGFSLKMHGGKSYLFANDINDHLQATTDYWNDRGVDVDGEFDPLQNGIEFGGEFIVNLAPHIGIGLGGGYIQASSESTVNNVWFGYSYQDTARPKVTAIPLTLSAYFDLPLAKRLSFTVQVGLGYYLGTFSWDYSYESEFDDFKENWEGKSNALGFHGSLGFEFNFSSRIALFVESFGRYAKLKALKGNYTFEETFFGYQGQESIDEATLWYYEWRSSLTGNYYPTLEFNDEKPEETSFVKNIREGEVDLTGFSVRVGIRIRFN
ncbi:MAG: hypothetical protein GTO17_04100 [Candidatus Aminicenantes bacterium]|nr:hypothetical protein [Candidatus Aminicenantes bacterium]